LVVSVVETFVSLSVMITVAPTTTAPDGSVTWPTMVPWAFCAKALGRIVHIASRNIQQQAILASLLLFSEYTATLPKNELSFIDFSNGLTLFPASAGSRRQDRRRENDAFAGDGS
jgi:hypothetical protein